MMARRAWTEVLSSALLAVFLVLASFNIVASSGLLYDISFARHDVQQRLPGEDIHATHEEVMAFLRSETSPLPRSFSAREKDHFRDVRLVWQVETWILFLSLFGSLVVTLVDRAGPRQVLRQGGRYTALSAFILLVLAVAVFPPVFLLFHEAFFPAGSYLFDPAVEKIVVLYPQALFVDLVIASLSLAFMLGALCWWAGTRRGKDA